jgi:hypothetical protein
MGSLIRGMRSRACVFPREILIFLLHHAIIAEPPLKTVFLKKRDSNKGVSKFQAKKAATEFFAEIVRSPLSLNNPLRFTGESGCFRYAD